VLIPPPSCCYQESGGVRLLNDHHLLCWPISISPPFFSQLVTDLLGAELASHARGEIDDCAAKRSDCDRWSPWQPPFENIYLFQSNIMTLSRVGLFKKEQPTAADPAKIIVERDTPGCGSSLGRAACYTSPSSEHPQCFPPAVSALYIVCTK
jgi:hypothetical protein